jgi:hypothetical protein
LRPILEQALQLGACGLPVFPLCAGKTPHVKSRGFHDATTDPDAIRDLFRRYRGSLIGMATGEMSGIDALDIDSIKHPEAGLWLQLLEPIETRRHRTRSGGLHLLFRHAAGLGSSHSYPVAGVDLRADGGYIVWWPGTGSRSSTCPLSPGPRKYSRLCGSPRQHRRRRRPRIHFKLLPCTLDAQAAVVDVCGCHAEATRHPIAAFRTPCEPKPSTAGRPAAGAEGLPLDRTAASHDDAPQRRGPPGAGQCWRLTGVWGA